MIGEIGGIPRIFVEQLDKAAPCIFESLIKAQGSKIVVGIAYRDFDIALQRNQPDKQQ